MTKINELLELFNTIPYKTLFSALVAFEEHKTAKDITKDYLSYLEDLYDKYMDNDDFCGLIDIDKIKES